MNEATPANWIPALIARLINEAQAAELRALSARLNRQRTAAQREDAAAKAYYHAARLAGWRTE